MTAVTAKWPLIGRRPQLDQMRAALADPDCDAVVVVGDAGVGKSRLADECASLADAAGLPIARAVASEAAAQLPLGALSHLFSVIDEQDDALLGPARIFERARRAFQQGSPSQRTLLVLDDAHLLDASSITLITQLVASRLVILIATVRMGRGGRQFLDVLPPDRCIRIDLGDLDLAATDSLLHLALGAPFDGETVDLLYRTSGGNVMLLRELVMGAVQATTLVQPDGVWKLNGPLVTGPLIDVVRGRLPAIPTEARPVLEMLALCGPVPLPELEHLVTFEHLADLEAAGIISADADGRSVRLAHPLFAEAIAAETPVLRRRMILQEHADTVERTLADDSQRVLQVAMLRMAAGQPVDPVLLTRAAHVARHAEDYATVVRLLGPVAAASDDHAVHMLLAEALAEIGRPREADATLASARERVTGEERLTLDLVRVTHAITRLFDVDTARRALDAARGSAPTDPAVVAAEAAVVAFTGQPNVALAQLETADWSRDSRALQFGAIASVIALTDLGRTIDALEHAGRWPAEVVSFIGQPGLERQLRLLAMGQHLPAEQTLSVARAVLDDTVGRRLSSPRLFALLTMARVALVSGDLAEARRRATECATLAATAGVEHLRRVATAVMIAAAEQSGEATENVDGDLDRVPVEVMLAQGWQLAGRERTQAAVDLFIDGAKRLADNGQLAGASWLLHDAVRLGAHRLADDLGRLAAGAQSPLVLARAQHALAMEKGDPQLQVEVASTLEQLGCYLAAAETLLAASQQHRRDGDQRAAAAAALKGASLAARCEGASTPGLRDVDAAMPLSGREREIATLAASGMANKDIAARLFVSARTIDNHLHNIYAKLGIGGRGELAAALSSW